MKTGRQKLYCYVDETGQDTAGRFFAVSVLVTKSERDELLKQLEAIERRSGKGVAKWKKSRPRSRKSYIEAIARLRLLQHALFVGIFRDSKNYLLHTADAIARTLRHRKGSQAIVYVDALRDSEQLKLKRQLKPSIKIPLQVRGVRREENSAFIRLVDTICGLVRDADEGDTWAEEAAANLKARGILESL